MGSPARSRAGVWLVLSMAFAAYLVASEHLGSRRQRGIEHEFSVRLPVPAQVLMAAGDRNLAANLDGFRVLVADTARMKKEDYALQAGLQKDVSVLNPAHEDNYYIAAAILPWGGQIDAAQFVLRRAAAARPFDWQPLFYYGFHEYHFFRNPVKGAESLLAGVARARDPQDQWALQNIAALWIERGYRLNEAASRVEAMANAAPAGNFRKYLALRAARLRDLDQLRGLAREFEARTGRKLLKLEELVSHGLIVALPVDPLGVGFALTPGGEPVFRDSLRGGSR